MTENKRDREDYWASFYSDITSRNILQPPSQFASFVAQEVEPGSIIFDVGCGNGRDSIFFAELGFRVVSIDRSENAIKATDERAKERGISNIQTVVGDISGPVLATALADLKAHAACIYARFFLHSITDDEQKVFLQTLADKLKPGHLLAFEYRTTEDQHLQKEAPPHYRRYQDAVDLNASVEKLGFRCVYKIEGQGYAKYKNEDAIVARVIFEKV